MGTKIALPETFTASTGKVLLDDYILPPAGGALILVDVNHSLGGLGTGDGSVPADLGNIPNIAWKQAAAMIGSGDQSSLMMQLDRTDGTNFVLERTGKKGLHCYQSGDIATNVGAVLRMGPSNNSFQSYIYAHLDHKFYFSAWDRVTRVASVQSGVWPMFEGIQSTISSLANFLTYFDTNSAKDGGQPATDNTKRLGVRVTPGNNVVGNTFRNVAANGWSHTLPTSAAQVRNQIALWGSVEAYSAFLGGRAAPSYILYRVYLEDLTVSGRTWAQVDAIDKAMFDAAFAAGGKFYGDTFTASPI